MKCKLELCKEVENFNWVNLEINTNDDSLNNTKDKVIHGYYPSSSKVKKDWSQLDKEIDEQEKEDATKDGKVLDYSENPDGTFEANGITYKYKYSKSSNKYRR